MRRAREGLDRGLDGLQRGVDEAPFAPAAFHPAGGEGDGGIGGQRGLDAVVILAPGAGVEMDGDEIPRRRQPLGLRDDPGRVLVAQEDIGNLRHFGNGHASVRRFVALDSFIGH